MSALNNPNNYGPDDPTLAKQKNPADVVPESWMPRDTAKYLDPNYVPPQPDVLLMLNGAGLFYSGVVNEIHGAAGDGKTMVALAACVERLKLGERVLYLNYEEADGRIITRLLMLGASESDIIERFDLVRPEEAPTPRAVADLKSRDYRLVVIDTVGESIQNVSGGTADSNSTDDVTKWHTFARAFSDAGACVVVIDHITKALSDAGGNAALFPIGSQAKYSGYKGTIFFLKPVPGLRRGGRGGLRIILAKDNGAVIDADKGQHAGTFWLDSTYADAVTWGIDPAPSREQREAEAAQTASAADAEKRAEIVSVLKRADKPISKSAMRRGLDLSGNSFPEAYKRPYEALKREGVIIEAMGAKNATMVSLSTSLPKPPNDPPTSQALLGLGEGGEGAHRASQEKPAIPSHGRSGEGGEGTHRASQGGSGKLGSDHTESGKLDAPLIDPATASLDQILEI